MVEHVEHLDVVIVGAGLSGIGAAWHLRDAFPGKSYALLESRQAMGGTWDLFRYPGVRSDSDMHTLGYRFRPWLDAKAIADGPSILSYIRATAEEAGIDKHIRYGHKVTAASWSTEDALWTVEAVTETGDVKRFTCGFLLCCSGYYRYDRGFTPEFPGAEDFAGTIVHPQKWPEDLDHTGKNVVVIGSGATAVTLVPAMAADAAHVTMVQRSPTYIVALPSKDAIANRLRSVLGPRRAYGVTRWKNALMQIVTYQLSRRRPDVVRRLLRKLTIKALPPGFDVDTHFNPVYNPWDQRLCVVPDGDLFRVLARGEASIVTDKITRFDATGVQLESGTHLDADVIVTATGLDLQVFGGATLTVDGEPVEVSKALTYKGMMLADVPNFAFTIGYTNASWTLKADLVSEFVVRVMKHMTATGKRIAVPVNDDPTLERRPLLDFAAGYVQRALHRLPQAGSRKPWQMGMSYVHDVVALRHGPLDDGAMRFTDPVAARSSVGATEAG
ncbi:flavin-containing monooxygenase [Labedaea rhizosphaerae]|uniref:Cation diffusion facilitator CzcD-associated flavoprotein CzcO n=1 Tax=Labedaea rhizosphaerae TaxID=598644 RepID=A0A4R6SIJ6_LABRH|nr:NAD(P)/FAD-dependent oxidoreductase [Labedaea rhizosphaerae]TDQ00709.1 cation diffusion facilitator CzcD-associated flavoprotein CzcO [Labedaea rhizosphaerae]